MRNIKKEIFWDVETKSLFSDVGNNIGNLGVSIVSIYSREIDISNNTEIAGQIKSFWEKDFNNMWPLFQNADRIVGFNTVGFDVPVLQPYTTIALNKLNNFDILNEFKKIAGHRISLDALASGTIGAKKTDVGTNAVKYWRAGDPDSLAKLQSYCEADVIITKDLYQHILENKKVTFKDKWNTPRSFELDFSYPQEQEQNSEQLGLLDI